MASNVVYVSEFATDKLTISAPRVLESGAKQAYLNYDGGKLTLQSATNLSVPFGLSVFDKSGPAEYSIDMSFRGHETNAEIKEFLEKMQALDEFMIDQGVKNSKTWFKSNLTRDVVKEFYTRTVRFAKDAEGNIKPYPPTLKLKLRKVDGKFETKFFNVKGQPYTGTPIEDLLPKGVQITALMDCAGVWFAGSKFGLTWRAKQIVIHRLPERVPEFTAFRLGDTTAEEDDAPVPKKSNAGAGKAVAEDEENEVSDDEELKAPPQKAKASVVSAVMPQASSANVDEEPEDSEPAPVPKKPVLKKKPVVAKK
jgi:hypothetical protein